jgi:hypothetical protein
MWCKNCRQDVPAVAAGDGRAVRCARCGGALRRPEPVAVTVHTAGLEGSAEPEFDSGNQETTPLEPCGDLDDWALDAELHRLNRLLTSAMPAAQSQSPTMLPQFSWPASPAATASPANPVQASLAVSRVEGAPRRRASVVVWSLLGFGIMAFVCGAILLAWSLVADRTELWTLGMPVCLAGQLGLLLGLVFQLSRLWDDNRRTASQLASVDQRLDDLQQTATLLTTGHTSPAQSFYAHLAGGASPQLLLADLKSQLDLLAVQMSSTRR